MKILPIWAMCWLILLYVIPNLWRLLVTDLCFNSLGAVVHRSGYMKPQPRNLIRTIRGRGQERICTRNSEKIKSPLLTVGGRPGQKRLGILSSPTDARESWRIVHGGNRTVVPLQRWSRTP